MPIESGKVIEKCAAHIQELLQKPEYSECSGVDQELLYQSHENHRYQKGICPILTALTFDHGICSFSSKFGTSIYRPGEVSNTFRATSNMLHGSFPNCHDTQKDITIPVSSVFQGADGYGPTGYTHENLEEMKKAIDEPRDELIFHKGTGRRLDVQKLSPLQPVGMRNLRQEINQQLGLPDKGGPRVSQEDFYKSMRNTDFCLCPYGDGLWSPRLVESLAMGCIPVIFAFCRDFKNCPELDSTLPYFDYLDYNTFSVILNADKVPQLEKTLSRISAEERVMLRKNGQRVQPFFNHRVDGKYEQGTSTLDLYMFELWMRQNAHLPSFGRRSVIMGKCSRSSIAVPDTFVQATRMDPHTTTNR
jgi:hypothetical protein